jgi:UDP-N-acetylmuramoyl-tripeptide--D-alanyl-D-alanine ligase
MLELGSETVELHKLVGTYTSSAADVLVTYGDLAKYIAEGSDVKEKYSFSIEEREELKSFLARLVKEKDTVLYKASNGINLGQLIV